MRRATPLEIIDECVRRLEAIGDRNLATRINELPRVIELRAASEQETTP